MHLVLLSAVTWNFRLGGRSRALTEAWVRIGQPATFVQIPSYRTLVERVTARWRPRDSLPVIRPKPTLPVHWSGVWPSGWRAKAICRKARLLRRQLDRVVNWEEAVGVVVSPAWAPWLDELPFRAVIYDCIDDLMVHVPNPRLGELFRRWEEELIGRVQGAVAVAESLRRRLEQRRPGLAVALIRNGVDADGFARAARQLPRPADLPETGRRIIGFVGALYEWVDCELIARTARVLPECDFVFVGPHDRRGDIGKLAGLRNVRLLGYRPYAEVPAYVQAFDVCWVPFRAGPISAASNPAKIYEYLALGKRVVSTPIADVEAFSGFVEVARTAAETVACLRAMLSHEQVDAGARMAFARANSWWERARDFARFARTVAGLADQEMGLPRSTGRSAGGAGWQEAGGGPWQAGAG
jgi:glycosyltransferase involved in cell wall biosynthesis